MAHAGDIKSADVVARQQLIATETFGPALVRNLLVALTISFIALSLGAAFGVLSGRGAFSGMISAGIIAFIAAAVGGTRVQCSGPTAPMAAVMAGLSMAALSSYGADQMALGGMTPDHYLNLICLLCGGVMILMGIFRMGLLIHYVPDTVISGFMTGIALIIWLGQGSVLFGIGKEPLQGDMLQNIIIAFASLAAVFLTKPVLNRIIPKYAQLLPGALVALVLMVAVTYFLKMDVEYVTLDTEINGFADIAALFKAQIPQNISWEAVKMGIGPGFELALISFLDTLMVALIVDRMTGETTRKNKETIAQGIANAAVSMVGGVPGTQASIRSVLMIKEGATWRAAGVMVGVFVLIEMLMFQDVIALIPKAAFTGILFKVGWDVCDRGPIWAFITRKKDRLSNVDFITLIGTALVTIEDLTVAVLTFTAFWYTMNVYQKRKLGRVSHAESAIEHEIEHVLEEKV
ncbi:MAG TPA: SulP family inorganic anion transporter [Alphaproteobacteria bacterium]